MLLAPLFVFIRADFGVSYTELGFALTLFSLVSLVAQTPVGFFIDKTDPRLVLVCGLLLGSAAIAIAGSAHSFWVFLAMYGVLGLANTVYHPADYALLSEYVAPERMTQVFSYHTCAGMIGSAIAPGTLLFMHSFVGWRGAFFGASVLGVIAALILLSLGGLQADPASHIQATRGGSRFVAHRLAAPIVGADPAQSPVLLPAGDGQRRPKSVPRRRPRGAAWHAASARQHRPDRATRHERDRRPAWRRAGHLDLASRPGGRLWPAGDRLTAYLGIGDPGAILLIFVVALSGLASGVTFPSRDMIVRAATPRGSFGKVFAFVTTGFHIGGIIAPPIFGQFLDHGQPQFVFFYIAVCSIVAVASVSLRMSSQRSA